MAKAKVPSQALVTLTDEEQKANALNDALRELNRTTRVAKQDAVRANQSATAARSAASEVLRLLST